MKTKSIYLLMFLILKTNSGQLEGNLSSNVCWKEGFFRNPFNCQKFYRCVDVTYSGGQFTIFHFDCPAGTTFDELLQTCNFPWYSKPCRDSSANFDSTKPGLEVELTLENDAYLTEQSTSGSGKDLVGMLWSVAQPVEHFPQGAEEPSSNPSLVLTEGVKNPVSISPKFEVIEGSLFDCKNIGFYPVDDNCVDFYVCIEILPGILLADQVYRCPERYLFDDVKRRCLREASVVCYKELPRGKEDIGKEVPLVVLEEFLDKFFDSRLTFQKDKNVME